MFFFVGRQSYRFLISLILIGYLLISVNAVMHSLLRGVLLFNSPLGQASFRPFPAPYPTVHSKSNMAGRMNDRGLITLARPSKTSALQAISMAVQ